MSQRHIKILAHEYVSEFTASLYIDNTLRLDAPEGATITQMLQKANIAVMQHSFRESVYDEFCVVAEAGLDDAARIFEQLNHYQLIYPALLMQRPFSTGFMFRRHHEPTIKKMMNIWFHHVNRYSRRDQLSFNIAVHECRDDPKAQVYPIEVDNFKSVFHTQIGSLRRTEKRKKNWLMSGAPTRFELERLQKQVYYFEEKTQQLGMLQQELDRKKIDSEEKVQLLGVLQQELEQQKINNEDKAQQLYQLQQEYEKQSINNFGSKLLFKEIFTRGLRRLSIF